MSKSRVFLIFFVLLCAVAPCAVAPCAVAPCAVAPCAVAPCAVAVPSFAEEPSPAPGGPAPNASAAPSLDLDIKEVRLPNGLRIFVLERHHSPTFAATFSFNVGGANDLKGAGGIAHLLEHMMFKGTESIGVLDRPREAKLIARQDALWHELHAEEARKDDPFQKADEAKIAALKSEIEKVSSEQKSLILKNEYDELMTRAGASDLNASTGLDSTTYEVELPSNRLEYYFRMESDRLLHPVFREFYSERDVVREERRMRYENSAGGKVREALNGLMFTASPYRDPVIGWHGDLRNVMKEDAEGYFKTFYSPSNCIMTFVGDVSVVEVEKLARKFLAPWKRQELPMRRFTEEPPQEGERRAVVEFNAEPQVMMGWVTVPEGHADQYPLDMLASILGGLSSSRLERSVVQEQGIAASVGSGHPTFKASGYFGVMGTPREGSTTVDLENAVYKEIERIAAEGVTQAELDRVKTSAEASVVQSLKSNLGLAFQISSSVQFSGGTAYIRESFERLYGVTPEQVKDVAQRYLKADRRNVVELKKVEDREATAVPPGAEVEHGRGGTISERGARHSKAFDERMKILRAAKPVELKVPEIGKDVERVVLDGGVTVFIKEDHSIPAVQIDFAWLGGSNTTPVEKLAPFEIASRLLTEGGTETIDPLTLQEKLDDLGMEFSLGTGATQSAGGFWSLKRNFDPSFAIAMDMLKRPRLDEARLGVIKAQYIEQMRRRYDNPPYAVSMLRTHVFYHDNPRLGYFATREEIEAITPDDIRAIWKRYMGKDNLFITAVGDFDSKAILDVFRREFGTWRGAEDKQRVYLTRDPVTRPGVYTIEKDLPQPAIRFDEQPKVDRSAPLPEHAALEILNEIMGGSGFRSRLMERLRSDEGLTYGIYSYIIHQDRPGVPGRLMISYQTKAPSVVRSIHSVLEEVRRGVEKPFSAAEVQEQVEAWRNRFIFQFVDEFYNVRRLMDNELDDRPYDFDQQVLRAIESVKPEDVGAVAVKYIKPENFTISVFGRIPDEGKAALEKELGLTVLQKSDVFRGGYDAALPAGAAAPPGR